MHVLFSLLVSATLTSSAAVTPPIPFTVEADSFEAFVEAERFVAVGSVVLEREGLYLTAERLDYNQKTGVAVASGGVTAIEGQTIVVCTRAELKLPELSAVLEQAKLRLIEGVGSSSVAGARGQRDRLRIDAQRLQRITGRTYDLKGAAITLCDCGEDKPSWSFTAKSAEVDLDSGAWLSWPVLRIKEVPVFVLPAFYVPLGPRRTGLLMPKFHYQAQILGFHVRQPLFITLGRSWDMTVEPGFFSARGPSLGLELRYATSTTTQGRWNADYIADFGERGPDGFELGSQLVSRFSLAGRHRSSSPGFDFSADVNAISDPAFVSEFADEFLARQAQYTRSAVVGVRRWPSFRFAAQAHLLQDLRPETYAGFEELRRSNLFSGRQGAGDVRYRFAELRLDAPYQRLLQHAPLGGSVRVSVQAFAAPRPDAARFVRTDLRPEFDFPISLPGGSVITPRALARFTLWSGRDQRENLTASRTAVGLGALWSGDWFRAYGPWLHRLAPRAEWLWLPWVSDDVLAPRFSTRDEIDLLSEVHQVRLGVESELSSPSGTRWSVQADISSDLDAPAHDGLGFSELLVRSHLKVPRPSWTLDLFGRAALLLQEASFTEVRADAGVNWRRFGVAVSYVQEGPRQPLYLLRAAEELAPSGSWAPGQYVPLQDYQALDAEGRRRFAPFSRQRSLLASVRVLPLEPLTVSATAVFSFDDPDLVRARYGDQSLTVLSNLVGRIAWDSPCRCWNGFVQAGRARDRPGFQFDFGLELSPLGGSW